MKKLMIAAAVAAFAGGAFAANYVYDFSATLKTTKGKNTKGTIPVNLGTDATGTNFWYNDAAVAAFTNEVKNVGGVWVPRISDASMKTNVAAQTAVISIMDKYAYKSAGKYCATYKIPYTGCFRTAGSVKLADVLSQEDCCSTTSAKLTNGVSTITYNMTPAASVTTIGLPLYQWFGSFDPDKANKTEMYAQVELKSATTNEVFKGYLAGQGTRAKKEKKYYINTLSGNIVGTLPAPVCPNCCTLPTPALAFDCVAATAPINLKYTAGFGTFRLKINTKKSTFK